MSGNTQPIYPGITQQSSADQSSRAKPRDPYASQIDAALVVIIALTIIFPVEGAAFGAYEFTKYAVNIAVDNSGSNSNDVTHRVCKAALATLSALGVGLVILRAFGSSFLSSVAIAPICVSILCVNMLEAIQSPKTTG